MDKNKIKYFIFNPPIGVAKMCADKFDQNNFWSELCVRNGQETLIASGWEVTLGELRQVHQDALAIGFTSDFKVLIRNEKDNKLKIIPKSDWHEPSQRYEGDSKQLKSLIRKRNKKIRFGV